jgi:putative flippase GtrA
MKFLGAKLTPNLYRYVLASLLANAFAYALYALITKLELTTQPVIALLVAGTLTFPLSFYLNRIWVFRSQNSIALEILRFSFGYTLALIYGALLLQSLLFFINNPYLAQFISMIALGISAFLLHSLWTFKKQ